MPRGVTPSHIVIPVTPGYNRKMKPLVQVLFLLVAMGVTTGLHARCLEVRLEPFPPLVNEDGTGLAVELLERVEEISDFRFNIRVMPYSRAKFEVRAGKADLFGPVPLGLETGDFEQWAHELEWHFDTRSDLFVLDEDNLDPERLQSLTIGVPLGNAGFFAALTGVPRDQFTETDLDNLIQMLASGRIDALLFERASTMRMLRRLDIEQVHYRNLYSIPAGFAVRRENGGEALAADLDTLFGEVDAEEITRAYRPYLELPDQGRVSEKADDLRP